MKGENERGKRKGKGKTKGDGFPKEYFKIHSGGLLKNGKPKDSIGWASDLWEKRNQDSIGWSGLLTFGKRRTKIRLGCLRCLLKNGKNQRFVQVDC
ncbi:unnamed protein product [Rhizophagus irregularis]|nr:unnamed protein product [Rhizophagus irregularis]